MSGGRYGYKCFDIRYFNEAIDDDRAIIVESITAEASNNESLIMEALRGLNKLQDDLKSTGDRAYALEWYMSGDIGLEELLKAFKEKK